MSLGTKVWNSIIIGAMLVICVEYRLPFIVSAIVMAHTLLSTIYLTKLEGDRD